LTALTFYQFLAKLNWATAPYNGTASTYTDTSVQAGATYYYAAFAYDDSRNYSDGTVSGAKVSALAE